MPTAPGEGLRPRPRGSHWSSIRAAGMNAAQLGASPGDPARRDGEGDAQAGNATVERVNQRTRLTRWSPKGTGARAGALRYDRQSPPRGPGGVFPPYVHRQTRNGNGVTPCVLSEDGHASGAGATRMAHGGGSRQKPTPAGKPQDMLTDVRLRGL